MAISKQFQAHTELKASDLNELVTQANDYVEATKVELEGGIDDTKEEIMVDVNKKPDTVNIVDYLVADAELPVASYYTYGQRPLYSISGEFGNIYYIAFCMAHFNAIAPSIALFTRSAGGKYIFYSQFRADHAKTLVEKHVALVFGGVDATPTTPGLMSAQDKSLLDDVVTEVFPVTVAVTSSNAGVREVGTSVTPTIVLDITRKGVDVAESATVTVSPSGTVGSDNKTITDTAISSGSKTYQIAVTQGGQTVNAPNQAYSFKNYLYKGSFPASQKAAVKASLVASIKSKTKILSDDKTLAQTTLAGGECYLFAVKGHVNLVVKNAKSGGTISVDPSDKGFITDFPQENNPSLTNEYSWIIVPASSSTWYFQITNS